MRDGRWSFDRETIPLVSSAAGTVVDLSCMPPPPAITPIRPEQVVEDILAATLARVQTEASPQVAAAAARFLARMRAKVL
jgi:hypothetical protein